MINREKHGVDTAESSSATTSLDIETGRPSNNNGNNSDNNITSSLTTSPTRKPTTDSSSSKLQKFKGFFFCNSNNREDVNTPTSLIGSHQRKNNDDAPDEVSSDVASSLKYHPSTREGRPIAILRFAVVVVWLAAACAVSYGVYSYTWHAEFTLFEIQYKVDAEKILDHFHATIDKQLVATNTLATTLTMYAKATDQTFPFVTMPDYVVAGSNARILADSAVIHWMPLVTEDDREGWEEYAHRNRHQVNDEFQKDEAFRRQEDFKYGHHGHMEHHHTRFLEGNTTTDPLSNSSWIVDNIVQDGSNYHYRIWSGQTHKEIPNGEGFYLPVWQRSPVNAARQATLNVDMAHSMGMAGVFPYWTDNKPKGALLQQAIIPHPNTKGLHDQTLFSSQYRHHTSPYQNSPTTKLSYPVYDGFGEDSKFVGVLATTLYWQLSFTDLFHHDDDSAHGLICVVENSFGQVFSYRVDGPSATYLGEGDPLINNTGFFYEEMMMVTNHSSHDFHAHRSEEERRSYTTVSLDDAFGQYKLRIYPTQHTFRVYENSQEPMIFTLVVASIFVVAAIIFLLYDFYVQKRHKTMLANGIEQAHHAAVAERELNEYLAHEVRNPLSAAMSACSFVSSAVSEAKPLTDEESRQSVREDVHIIKSSLQFINDLLRNMLDLHRAVNHRVVIQKKPIDLYHDVLEPVTSMLYGRDHDFEVQLDCPEDLLVETDSLRLRQVILNLGRNAAKFVEKGFVRLRGEVVYTTNTTTYDDPEQQQQGKSTSSSPSPTVRIYVEDSGSGIPVEKRKALFAKFQQSLDLLNQGTGVGLCLCERLVDAMGGNLWLDEIYDSGIEGCPGSRFVVDLKTAPFTSTSIEDIGVGDHDEKNSNSDNDQDNKILLNEACDIESAGVVVDATQLEGSTILDQDQRHTISKKKNDNIELQAGGDTNDPNHHLTGWKRRSLVVETSPKQSLDTLADGAGQQQHEQQRQEKERKHSNSYEKEEGSCVLPEELSVLFVDDDMILRKLFSRPIKKVLPGWKVQEASSGETAIRLVEMGERFDLIFMDQYMASTEKQLLGTEATRELRAKGVTSTICGLSANEKTEAFLKAGADGFMLKPVPCDKDELKRSLLKLLQKRVLPTTTNRSMVVPTKWIL